MIRAGAHALVGVWCVVAGVFQPWSWLGAFCIVAGALNIAIARERFERAR